jgi:predicted Abi (CAAX) family protease
MSSAETAESISNYDRYWQAPFNRPEHFPVGPAPDPARYRPIGDWVGRLILPLPGEREAVLGCWLELTVAPAAHAALVGSRVRLRWATTRDLNARFWGATRAVHFDENATEALAKGTVLGARLDGMEQVNPFESLAGAHANDDITVRLDGEVQLDATPADGGAPIVSVAREPTQVTGRYYALVRFIAPASSGDGYRVHHYDRAAGDFVGPEELVRVPEVVPDGNDTRNSSRNALERSPCNAEGWYIYGALDAAGQFVVQALAPRRLLRLEPDLYCDRTEECMAYLKPKAWRQAAAKGAATVALLCGDGVAPHTARESWREGDRALLIHLFGGIGGEKTEPAAKTPLYWGHFAFGEAWVAREPLADELRFEIVYRQIYAHNGDGLTAGALHYSRYTGDRQYGWLGVRPVQDILIKLDAITNPFTVGGRQASALEQIVKQLEVMAARYRIADGRGGTKVGMLNNCAQDSAQALYAAIQGLGRSLRGRGGLAQALADTPENARRLADLQAVGRELQAVLVPWGSARADWEYGIPVLGGGDYDGIIGSIGKAMGSWRTMLPPVAARAIAEVFFEHGASAWVLRTYQVGGHDPEIEPIVPNV